MEEKKVGEVRQIFENRILDLHQQMGKQCCYTYSDFLNLDQQSQVISLLNKEHITEYELFGGVEDCQRKVLRFGTKETLFYEEEYPISILLVTPKSMKFAETLSHRDYLGAVLNLGIDRGKIGDIFIQDKLGYIFCVNKISAFIQNELTRIKHTSVSCEEISHHNFKREYHFKEKEYIVSSLRLDVVIAGCMKLSRSKVSDLIKSKKCFLNDQLIEKESILLHDNDVITLRGYGKFIYVGCIKTTKSGKLYIKINQYV